VRKTILLYGALGGLLVVVLRIVDYRYLMVEHSIEIYGAIVASIFASLGIWLGLKLTKTKEVIVVKEREPVRIDPAKIEAMGITPREHEILNLIAA